MKKSSRRLNKFPLRHGFAVADLLIVIGVLSLLVALVAPAIQSAREASRRSRCLDNLRQMGLATHNHCVVSGDALPYTATNGADANGIWCASFSPHRKLLSYLEPSELLAGSDEAEIVLNQPGTSPSFSNPILQKSLDVTIPVFLCPSDRQRPGATNYRANMGYGPGVYGPQAPALSGFGGNTAGAFVHGRSTRIAEFRDGMSSTILYGEKLIGDGDPQIYRAWTDYFFYFGAAPVLTADEAAQACGGLSQAKPPHASYGGWTWVLGGWNSTWYNHILPPNARTPDCSSGGNAMAGGGSGAYGARSFHSGGVNVVLADGSARFVSDHIDVGVWRAYSTRAGVDGIGHEW